MVGQALDKIEGRIGDNWRKKGVSSPKQFQNPAGEIPLGVKARE